MPNDTNLYIRRTNPVNDAFSALFAGAGQIVDKIQMNNKQEDLLNDFRKTSSDLKQASQINFQAQNDILSLVPSPEGSRQPIQPVTIPKTEIYDKMINSVLGMNANYGQDASPYINALEGMYKNYFPDPVKPNDTTIGNDIIRRDAKGNYTKVYNGEDKVTPDTNLTNPNNWSAQKDESGNWYWGADQFDAKTNTSNVLKIRNLTPEEVRNQENYLAQKEKTGVFAPKPYRRSSPRKGTSPPTSQDVTDTLKTLKEMEGQVDESTIGDIAQRYGIYGSDEINQLVTDAYSGNVKEVEDKLKTYKDQRQTFDQSITDYNLKEIYDDLYNTETDPAKDENGVNNLYNKIAKAEQWVYNYAKSLTNAQANQLIQTFEELKSDVLASKYLK